MLRQEGLNSRKGNAAKERHRLLLALRGTWGATRHVYI